MLRECSRKGWLFREAKCRRFPPQLFENDLIGINVLLKRGKIDIYGCAFADLRINRNKTAVPSDDGVTDGQTQPKTLLAIDIFRRKIRIEYPRDIFRLNADSRIPQGQFNVAPGGQR